MAAARRVGVGEFIDKQEVRPLQDCRVQIEFLKHAAVVLEALARQDAQPGQQRGGVLAAVGFHDAHQHLEPVELALSG